MFSRKTVRLLLSTCLGDEVHTDRNVFGETHFFKNFLTIKNINAGCGAQVKVSKYS